MNCNKCTDETKGMNGCEKDSFIPKRWTIGEYSFSRCPLKIVDTDMYFFIKAYNFMEKGILPRVGGWMDQSNKFIQGMSIVISEVSKIAKEESHGR